MGFFKLFSQKKDSFWCILKRLNVHYRLAHKIERAFVFSGGVMYSPENLDGLRAAIRSGCLNQFLADGDYDMMGNNIVVFWIEDRDGVAKLLLVFDPFDVFSNEVLLEQIPSSAEFLTGVTVKREIEVP